LSYTQNCSIGYRRAEGKPHALPTGVHVTQGEARRIILALGELQTYLESCLESVLMPGERWPRDHCLRPDVASLRREWREVEALIKLLEGR
jgi:hypothetical protein